jgi:ribonucleoside-diphosphate reductase beta chain
MLFEEQVSRKPNLYPWTQEIIDALWTSHWTPNEFNFRSDYAQFHSDLTEEERGVVVRTLSAIGQIEIAVKRFWGDLGRNFPHPSMTDMGFVMANNEVIHNQAYEKLLDVLRLNSAFDDALKEPVVKGRVAYLKKYNERVYTDERKQYIYAIILFTLFVENASLFGQFYTIMHFNRFGNVLKDTAQQVQYTRNEEMLHARAGILLINTLRDEYPEFFDDELAERVARECAEAFEHEGKIVEWMLQGYEGEALSADIIKAFIKNRLAEGMKEIGFDAIELTDDEQALLPLTYWMDEETKGATMTDFFQKRPVEYSKSHRTYDEDDLFDT